jgi:hypothetical protein
MNELRGRCHCANVEFTFFPNKDLDEFVPRRCSCSMCRRHGASYISDPSSRLDLRCLDPSLLNFYRFGHGTSDWVICARCGVLTAVLCEIEGRLRAVVRVQSILEHTFVAAELRTNFDCESIDERLQRRARTWIGTVSLPPALISRISQR